MEEFDHLKLQLKEIISATDNFSRNKLIGRGGFGSVYRGELSRPEGQIIVACKRLDSHFGQGNIEFWKEIMMLSKCKHENLVSLLHFCNEGDERVLVYEYVSNRSLDRYLSDSNLTWRQRLKICIGVARGLNYLHDPKKTQQRVIHRDIKSSNILLDEKWAAKVSDFGLSKVGPANQPQTYVFSHAVGTFGYCDPVYWEMGFLSKESDVYSFGVVLFEVMCGTLCCQNIDGGQFKILVHKWQKCFDQDGLDDIVCDGLKKQMDPLSLKVFSTIAYQCLKKARVERPTMSKIIQQLEIALKVQELYDDMEKEMNFDGTKKIIDVESSLSYMSQSHLLLLFKKGILVDDGKTWFWVNKKGEHCELISAEKCSFKFERLHIEPSTTRVSSSRSFKVDGESKNFVEEGDLKYLSKLVQETDGGPAWISMMDRSTSTMSYQSWSRDSETGHTQYRCRTVCEDMPPEMMRDFLWDDEFRLKWDEVLLETETIEECPNNGTMVVKWVRKLPYFGKDREYIIARRIWESGNAYYCVKKGIEHPSVPRRAKPKRVDLYYSSWLIRAVESRKEEGKLSACEMLLFHLEDNGIPLEVAKDGVRKGLWENMKSIDRGLCMYQKDRVSGAPLSHFAYMAHINSKISAEQMRYLENTSNELQVIEDCEQTANDEKSLE